jgi:hypothetical protein
MKNHTKHKKRRSPANKRLSAEQRRLKNLEKGRRYRFVPGVSGNPSGRPAALFSKECRDKLAQIVPNDPLKRTYAKYFADQLAHKAMLGNEAAIVELVDRAEGKSRTSLEFHDNDPLLTLIAEMKAESRRIGQPEGTVPRMQEEETIQ